MEKVSLPTKTKIAAWWMIIVGGVGLIFSLMAWMRIMGVLIFLIKFLLPSSFFLFLAGCLLFLKRKIAWIFSVGILALRIITWIPIIFLLLSGKARVTIFFVIFLVSYFFPFIFIFLDRKNFWKIAK